MERTLNYELNKLKQIKGKGFGLSKDDYENLILFFDNYYGGKAAERKEYDILNKNIYEILKDSNDYIFNIIQGVKSYPNDKFTLSERLEILLSHLKKYYKLEYKDNIFENFKIKDKNERLLMMLKYLHSGEKSRSEIADDFGISERTVADNLAELQDGFTFLGTEMKVHSLQRATNKYKSLIHPVFLALNSAEIYSLTVGLKLLSEGTVFEDSLGRIANVVYEQLSESSKDMIDNHSDDTVHFGNDSMKFIDSRRIGQISDKPFAYFLKEPLECTVKYIENGNLVKHNGLLMLGEPSIGNIYDKVILDIEEGSINLDIEDIISITRADKDIYFKDW